VTFDVVSLQEAVAQRSQRIESCVVEAWTGTDWAILGKLTTVGHRRLLRMNAPATANQVRFRITGSRLEPTLAEIGLFKQAVAVMPPVISERNTAGLVTLSNTNGLKMVFTVDGALPTAKSPAYTAPISLPLGGTVQAACLTPSGQPGMTATKAFSGFAPIGWKIATNNRLDTAANAIDSDASTIWQTPANGNLPGFITVDMGAKRWIGGFSYLPRQDGSINGIAETYRFETSADGKTWTTAIASGAFGNIQNNPILQEAFFLPTEARLFRFTVLTELSTNGCASAAEISVLPAGATEGNR
jgi:alpha-L-fucosidase